MSSARHVLLISPVFHEYWRSVARGFEARGHRVTTHCYDEHVGLWGKARNKIVYEGFDRVRADAGTRRFEQAATAGARAALASARPDALVVIKGDLLGEAFWDDVDRAGMPSVLWLYDEIRRTRFTPDALRRHAVVASYSPLDVAALAELGVDAAHVPLAFDPDFAGSPRPSEDVIFIGARYPRRTEMLLEMQRHGVPVRAVGKEWSHRVFDRVRTWSWSRPPLPGAPQVTRDQAAGLMSGALATLNIHGDQDGFTMRTFEAAGVGALQLIDRGDIGIHYEPGVEILTFDSVTEIIDLVDRARSEPSWAARIRAAGRARTLAQHTFVHRAKDLEAMWG